MQKFRFVLLCGAVLGMLPFSAEAARRPGASRALRFEWPASQSAPAQDALVQARHVSMRGAAKNSLNPLLFFAREAGGTRNLWQAAPGEANADWTRITAENSAWQTAPLTTLVAPFWADEPLPDAAGRALFCITNATGNAPGGELSQISRFDLKTRRFTPLTSERARHRELALSPNGTQLAFVREAAGAEAVYVMPATGGAARRVLEGARHPAWQNENTLLLSGARSGLNGLYRVNLPADWAKFRPEALQPALLFPRAGQVAISPESGQICLAPDDKADIRDASGDARLILMAPDGSNARAVAGTEGARAPRYSPDGEMLFFDAPVGGARWLWMLPLLKIAPTAQILAVRALQLPETSTSAVVSNAPQSNAPQTVEIIGTVFAPEMEAPRVRLEVGQGAEPAQWEVLPTPRAPLHRERLALWAPPAGARGEWTVRLTAIGVEGESAQTTLSVTLPLAATSADTPFEPVVTSQTSIKLAPPGFGDLHTAPPRTTNNSDQVKIRTLPDGAKVFPDAARTVPDVQAELSTGTSVTAPPLAPPDSVEEAPLPPISPSFASTKPAPVPPASRPPARTIEKPGLPLPAPATGNLPSMALPPLPPPPGSSAIQPRRVVPQKPLPNKATPVDSNAVPDVIDGYPVRFDNTLPPEMVEAAPLGAPAALANGAPSRGPSRLSVDAPPVRISSAPVVLPATQKALPREAARETSPTSSGENAAPITVRGLPASMEVDASVPVSVALRNRSARSWETSGALPVRLLIRWYDVRSGMRAQYKIEWLRATVPPGGGALLNFTLKAPARSGRFRVSFSLVKLPNGQYQAPSASGTSAGDIEEIVSTASLVAVQ